MPSVSKQPSNEQESTHFFIMVLRAPRSSIKGKQGKEWVSRQRLRQAKVGKEGELPVLLFLPSRLLGPSVHAGVHRCTLPSENTPPLRSMTYSNPTTREKAETEYTA